ncbi:MAG: ribulose-phosphate 3-epimerase [Anaerovoracaceae bacterium]
MSNHIIAPSLLSADFSDLLTDIKEVEKAGVSLLHFDVMDGHFVPNISFGSVVLKSLIGKVDSMFDVHLMISDPKKYFVDFITNQTQYITFHFEAVDNHKEVISAIKKEGVMVGVSINPDTELEAIRPFLSEVDLVLVMSVFPGFGGQTFIEDSLRKISELADLRSSESYNYKIEIDGGINFENIEKVALAGAEIIVAGSAIFHNKDVNGVCEKYVSTLRKLVEEG